MTLPYRPRPAEIVTAAVAFARTTWRNDGAEGGTVHLLCDELEAAQKALVSAREHTQEVLRRWDEERWRCG